MKYIQNEFKVMKICLNYMIALGSWEPYPIEGFSNVLFFCYGIFSYLLQTGFFTIGQVIDLCLIWGDVNLMTSTMFLLLTNIALSAKYFNYLLKKTAIRKVINESNDSIKDEVSIEGREFIQRNNFQSICIWYLYIALSYGSIAGWGLTAEKNSLPLRAWFPYDTTKSPAYQITYAYQLIALFFSAFSNMSMDMVMINLMTQCRTRLQLLSLSLKTLGDDLQLTYNKKATPAQEAIMESRLRKCVRQHQSVLDTVTQLRDFIQVPTGIQFAVSMIIICVTAYQLAFESKNITRTVVMGVYLVDMMLQVFLYCNEGNELLGESSEVATAAYHCPWYTCSAGFRKKMVILMVRSTRVTKIIAGGFFALSLPTFMAIIKASYTFFTMLQQVVEDKM